jgi:hypothetical protein
VSKLPASAGVPLPGDDPLFAHFIAALEAMPRKKRQAALRSFNFWWNDLDNEDRAVVVRSYRNGLSDEEVAQRAGVSKRSLYRFTRDKQLKQRLTGDRETRRRRTFEAPDDAEE